MKVFIFGAGASLGSQDEKYNLGNPQRAPLVNELFNDAYKNYATDILTKDDLIESNVGLKSHTSIEKWLTNRWNNISTKDTKGKYAELTFYGRITIYVWRLLLAVSNTYNSNNAYNVLLGKVRQKGETFGLINFNYDTFLEQAITEQYGITFENQLADYDMIELVKPHGSVNWLLDGDSSGKTLQSGLTNDTNLRLKIAAKDMFNVGKNSMTRVKILPPNHKYFKSEDIRKLHLIFPHFPMYPLIFIPLTTKLHEQVEQFQDKIVTKGIELLGKANEIYLIGYRAEDDLIKEMFKVIKKEVTIHSVGLETSEEILDKVVSWNTSQYKKGKAYTKGFMDFVVNY